MIKMKQSFVSRLDNRLTDDYKIYEIKNVLKIRNLFIKCPGSSVGRAAD